MIRLAVIPARGGSKRLPRKNILPVNGQPMLFYPVRAAIESGMFDRIIVSTEDAEIEAAARKTGADVIKRPGSLAQDRSTVVQVCTHVLDTLKQQNWVPDYFCCIYATAVFITPDDISNSFDLFQTRPKPDVIMGVSDFNVHPVQALEEKSGFLLPKWPEYTGVQSQFHPQLVASNGTLYWAKTDVFKENPTFYVPKLKGYKIPKIRAVDVDTPEDLDFVRMIAEKNCNILISFFENHYDAIIKNSHTC